VDWLEIGITRRRARLTQEQLARRMGVSVSTVQKWERGVVRMPRHRERRFRRLTVSGLPRARFSLTTPS